MNIQASDLKATLKKLAPAKVDSYVVGPHGIEAHAADVWLVADSGLTR